MSPWYFEIACWSLSLNDKPDIEVGPSGAKTKYTSLWVPQWSHLRALCYISCLSDKL